MTSETLIEELHREFAIMKRELKLKSTFNDLEKIYFLSDMVLKDGFVSKHLSRIISHRIVDTYLSWVYYLQSLVVPNPGMLVNITESQMFTDEEKDQMMQTIAKILAFTSQNSVIALTKDKKKEAEFIDSSVAFWNKTINPALQKFMHKAHESWQKKAGHPQKKK
ncbi:MAG: hypothetical protein V1743_04960 [Nanoarchaeota archaeon]